MAEQFIDLDQPLEEEQQDPVAQQEVTAAIRTIASLNARAVMPDGKALSREEILSRLGLDPRTPPTAWLTIIGCISNASALLPGDLQRVAVTRVTNASTVLRSVQQLGSAAQGFVSGGSAPR